MAETVKKRTTRKRTTKKKEEQPTVEPRFSKERLIRSDRYAKVRDLIEVLLDDEKTYTFKEVNNLIDRFLKGVV